MRNKFARKHLVSPASGDVISLNDLDEMNFHRVYGDGYAMYKKLFADLTSSFNMTE